MREGVARKVPGCHASGMVPATFSFPWKGILASKDGGDVGVGSDDAAAGEAEEAARKVA